MGKYVSDLLKAAHAKVCATLLLDRIFPLLVRTSSLRRIFIFFCCSRLNNPLRKILIKKVDSPFSIH
jgi:hypothetical protein